MSFQPGDRVRIQTKNPMFDGMTGTVQAEPVSQNNDFPHTVRLDHVTPAIAEEYAFSLDLAKSMGVDLDAYEHGADLTYFATAELVAA